MGDLFSAESKRVFIAIEFTENIKNYLHRVQNIVVNESEKGSFADKENFHLTLKFIGEVKISDIEKIKECINKTALNQDDFQLYIDKLGQFPRGNKSIVWVGLKPNDMINKLYSNLEIALEEIGIKRELRDYKSHITIGRQVIFNEDFNKLKQKIKIEDLVIDVNKISLMESARIDGKLRYVPLYVKKF